MKTSELIGPALDWAVAEALGCGTEHLRCFVEGLFAVGEGDYSGDWREGGPIIERERMTITYNEDDGCWEAYYPDDVASYQRANSPLTAAMRCYVASKLGDEAEIPEDLQ